MIARTSSISVTRLSPRCSSAPKICWSITKLFRSAQVCRGLPREADDSRADGRTEQDGPPQTTDDRTQQVLLLEEDNFRLDVSALRTRKQELDSCIERFNQKPKKGIDALVRAGFLPDNDATQLCAFFRSTQNLDKTAIGDYIGENTDYGKVVLQTMANFHSFRGRDLDAALRAFLADFRLPGEAQKIDRIVEKFADKYCEDNPDNEEFGMNTGRGGSVLAPPYPCSCQIPRRPG